MGEQIDTQWWTINRDALAEQMREQGIPEEFIGRGIEGLSNVLAVNPELRAILERIMLGAMWDNQAPDGVDS